MRFFLLLLFFGLRLNLFSQSNFEEINNCLLDSMFKSEIRNSKILFVGENHKDTNVNDFIFETLVDSSINNKDDTLFIFLEISPLIAKYINDYLSNNCINNCKLILEEKNRNSLYSNWLDSKIEVLTNLKSKYPNIKIIGIEPELDWVSSYQLIKINFIDSLNTQLNKNKYLLELSSQLECKLSQKGKLPKEKFLEFINECRLFRNNGIDELLISIQQSNILLNKKKNYEKLRDSILAENISSFLSMNELNENKKCVFIYGLFHLFRNINSHTGSSFVANMINSPTILNSPIILIVNKDDSDFYNFIDVFSDKFTIMIEKKNQRPVLYNLNYEESLKYQKRYYNYLIVW
jgi:hypothetical protein